jgi:hypothetical protein
MYQEIGIQDVVRAIKPLADIPRPPGDNEGDYLNSDNIMRALSHKHRDQAIHAIQVLYDYTRESDGQPNRRSINTLTRHGFNASLNEAQEDTMRLVGRVTVGEWDVDISDPSNESEDD